jgi:hypothetical protein
MERVDILWHEHPTDRSAGEYECKACYGWFDFKERDGGLRFCPLCGGEIDRVFDLPTGRHAREVRQHKWGRKSTSIKGGWEVITTEPPCFPHETEPIEYSHMLPFSWYYLDKLRGVLETRRAKAADDRYTTVRIERKPPQYKPTLPQTEAARTAGEGEG